MSNKSISSWFSILMLTLGTWAVTERVSANATPSVPRKFQQQVDRADYVAHVVIEKIESLNQVDNGPKADCGLKYHVRVVEQYKGTDSKVTSFATERFLLFNKKLEAGDHVLVLLQNVTGIARASDMEGDRSIAELLALSIKPRTEACQRARGHLFLTDFAENIFLIRTSAESKTWMEFFRGTTIITPDIGTPDLAPCEPPPGPSCVSKRFDRIEWEHVRKALRSGTKSNK
jgi:hypothetical protein